MHLVAEPLSSLYPGKRVRDSLLAVLTGIALFLCWLLVKPFLASLTWAMALSIVAHPWQRRLERHLHPNAAAFAAVFLIMAVVLAPGILLVERAIDETRDAITATGTNAGSDSLRPVLDRVPVVGPAVRWLEERFDLNQELSKASGMLAKQASAFVSGSARVVAQFAIMLVILFFFLRDGRKLLGYLRDIVPLAREETEQLFTRISKTVYATLYGNVVVKIVQGVLGGAMFWALGLPAPVIFGAVMAVCAMLPIVGTSIVWGPAAIFLLIHGSWVKAIVLAAWGGFVISLIDNVLYPILVASELRIHTLGVLLSILGGLIAFGLAGVVLGPVILASTIALLGIWRARAGQEQVHLTP